MQHPVIREHGEGPRHLVKRDRDPAKGKRQPQRIPLGLKGAEAQRLQAGYIGVHPDFMQQVDGGHIEAGRQRNPQADGPVVAVVEIQRHVDPESPEILRDIRQRIRRGKAVLKRKRIQKGLHGAARLVFHEHAVYLAGMRVIIKGCVPHPDKDFSSQVVQHDSRPVVDTGLREFGYFLLDILLGLRHERAVYGQAQAGWQALPL